MLYLHQSHAHSNSHVQQVRSYPLERLFLVLHLFYALFSNRLKQRIAVSKPRFQTVTYAKYAPVFKRGFFLLFIYLRLYFFPLNSLQHKGFAKQRLIPKVNRVQPDRGRAREKQTPKTGTGFAPLDQKRLARTT